MLQGILGVI